MKSTSLMTAVVSMTRLRPNLLLRACALLRDRGVEFRCVVVGDGPCRNPLTVLRAQLKLETTVEMTGAATRMRRAAEHVTFSHVRAWN